MDGDVENGNVSGGYGPMNIHTLYQNIGFRSFITSYYSDDNEIKGYLKNSDLSCVIF